MLIVEQRASTILFNYLLSNRRIGVFLLPANICPVVPVTFLKANVPFEFIDIDPDTLCLDVQQALQRVSSTSENCMGLLYAHSYGDPTNPSDFFLQLKAKSPDLLLIDDKCLCIPDFSTQTGSPADLTLFSAGYGKMVDIGNGGVGLKNGNTDYKPQSLTYSASSWTALEQQFKQAIEHRSRFRYTDTNWLNGDEIKDKTDLQNRVARQLPIELEHRQRLNELYSTRLPKAIQLSSKFQLWRFSIIVPGKTKLLTRIFENGLFASSHYASLGGIFDDTGKFPNAEYLQDHVINLFNDHHFSSEQANAIINIILEHLKEHPHVKL